MGLQLRLQAGQQKILVVLEHTAAQADAFQVQAGDQIEQKPAHHRTHILGNGQGLGLAGTRGAKEGRSVGKTLAGKAPGQCLAADQAFYVAPVAATAQGAVILAHKTVAPVAGVAVFAAQGAAVHAHTHANAGTPGNVGAMVGTAQSAPAPFGLQRAYAIVLQMQCGDAGAQRRLKWHAGPVVGQTSGLGSRCQAPANIGRGQSDHAALANKRPARDDAYRAQGLYRATDLRAMLLQHAQNLLGQGLGRAFFGRGLGPAAPDAAGIGQRQSDLGAANIDPCDSAQVRGEVQCIGKSHS